MEEIIRAERERTSGNYQAMANRLTQIAAQITGLAAEAGNLAQAIREAPMPALPKKEADKPDNKKTKSSGRPLRGKGKPADN
jgi:hypothetical protein